MLFVYIIKIDTERFDKTPTRTSGGCDGGTSTRCVDRSGAANVGFVMP